MGEPHQGSIYDAVGGDRVLLELARAWHRRCLDDPIAAHPFSHGDLHPQHVERLAAYWAEALGGPTAYTDGLGDHSTVLRMHAGNGPHVELDERAVQCFDRALDDVGLAADPRVRDTLQDYFRWATALMAEHPGAAEYIVAGLPLPHWSWDGPVVERTGP